MSDERLTTDEAIRHLESIIYEDFAPHTQKCLLKVIEAARQVKSMERIVERLEDTKGVAFLTLANTGDTMKDIVYDEVAAYLNTAIEIAKGGGVDETD